jgi:putative flippase GtrA
MALAQNRLVTATWVKLRSKVGVRFTRFAGAALAALTASEVALAISSGPLHMTSTPSALVSWFAGAVVSYILSRWAWERKGKPDVLRETIPFWVISALVIVILTGANKFGYHSASWFHLTHLKRHLWIGFVWLVANACTFVMRFLIFHFVLFSDRTTAARAAATGPDAVPPGTRTAPAPAAAPTPVAVTAPVEPAATAATPRRASDNSSAPKR